MKETRVERTRAERAAALIASHVDQDRDVQAAIALLVGYDDGRLLDTDMVYPHVFFPDDGGPARISWWGMVSSADRPQNVPHPERDTDLMIVLMACSLAGWSSTWQERWTGNTLMRLPATAKPAVLHALSIVLGVTDPRPREGTGSVSVTPMWDSVINVQQPGGPRRRLDTFRDPDQDAATRWLLNRLGPAAERHPGAVVFGSVTPVTVTADAAGEVVTRAHPADARHYTPAGQLPGS